MLGGAAGVFAIFRRYNARPAGAVPLEIDGKPNYNFGPVKFASLAALFWGVAGMAVGIYIAFELAYPWLNLAPWFNFGRLRPLHTSAVIFAFGGNVLLATSFYVVQRTCRARLAGDLAPWFVVLGYNFFIVIAGTGYLLGITESKEYAEPEWYADLWLTIVWVIYLLVFLATIFRRKEPHIYRRQLVLPRLHRHHRDAPPRQQRGDSDLGILIEVGDPVERRAGRDVPVVVRP